jgi:hypothetical protein
MYGTVNIVMVRLNEYNNKVLDVVLLITVASIHSKCMGCLGGGEMWISF